MDIIWHRLHNLSVIVILTRANASSFNKARKIEHLAIRSSCSALRLSADLTSSSSRSFHVLQVLTHCMRHTFKIIVGASICSIAQMSLATDLSRSVVAASAFKCQRHELSSVRLLLESCTSLFSKLAVVGLGYPTAEKIIQFPLVSTTSVSCVSSSQPRCIALIR